MISDPTVIILGIASVWADDAVYLHGPMKTYNNSKCQNFKPRSLRMNLR